MTMGQQQAGLFFTSLIVLSLCSYVAYAYFLKRLGTRERRMTRREFKRFMRTMCAESIENMMEQLALNGAVDPNTGRHVKITDAQARSFLHSFYWHYPDLKPKKRKQPKEEVRQAPVIKHELDAVVFALSRPKRA